MVSTSMPWFQPQLCVVVSGRDEESFEAPVDHQPRQRGEISGAQGEENLYVSMFRRVDPPECFAELVYRTPT
jgi:hypothetical protein